MDIGNYMDVLKWTLQMAINTYKDTAEKPFVDKSFYDGITVGLEIALEKIEASRFLAEK